MIKGNFRLFIVLALPLLIVASAAAQTPAPSLSGMPLLFSEDFDEGMDRWETTDPEAWKVVREDGDYVLSLEQQSDYEPSVRSPHNIALIKDLWVSDFILEAKLKSTSRPYGHRDLCLFYGWQNPSHFYYTHIAVEADPHANSIFLVNGAPRVSIADERTEGTDWDDHYHTVRIVRDVDEGTIEVYFDDFSEPIMRAEDKHFTVGRIGLGSFDDTGLFDEVRVWGVRAEPPSSEE